MQTFKSRFNNFDSRVFFLYLGPTPVFLKGPSVFVGPRNGTACGQRLAGRGLFLFRGDMELKVPTPIHAHLFTGHLL